jgi:predicted HTH domain antitoxin
MSGIKDVTEIIREKYGEKKVDESEMARALMVRGFEQKLMELYEDFKSGVCSLGYLAEQLGISTWEAYDILEKKGLRTTNL